MTPEKDFAEQSIRLRLHDLEDAARDGLVTPDQAQKLWQRWSAAGLSGAAAAAPAAYASGPRFSFTHVLYYFGGMVAIGAMSLFMTLGFEQIGPWALLLISVVYAFACLKVADYFVGRDLPIPAGILATLAVVLISLITWSVQSVMGLWPPGGSEQFSAYHTVINWRWLTLEFATLAAGAVMLWRYRLPFMVMPITVTIWYMSMDVANGLMQNEGLDWQFSREVSQWFGIATCALAMWVDVRSRRSTDIRSRQDFAFWLYIFGAIMFWGALSLHDSDNEWSKLAYCVLNLALIFGGAAIGRRVFTVLGAFGVAIYLGHLAHQVFRDSLMFPFALTLLGLGFVALGVWWQRHEADIQARLQRALPWLPV